MFTLAGNFVIHHSYLMGKYETQIVDNDGQLWQFEKEPRPSLVTFGPCQLRK